MVGHGTEIRVLKVLRGSFGQCDMRFATESRGVQRMANAFTSLAKHTLHSVSLWCVHDLDAVLIRGDEVYTDIYCTNATVYKHITSCLHFAKNKLHSMATL